MDDMDNDSRDALQVLRHARCSSKVAEITRQGLVEKLYQQNTVLAKAMLQEEQALISYAQSCMRHITWALPDKLPRELRDYIYALLWEPTLDESKSDLNFANFRFAQDLNSPGFELPVFALPEYTSRVVADEALSHLYRETFQKRPEYPLRVNSAVICRYLAGDIFGRGFRPLIWVREVYIEWDNLPEEADGSNTLAAFDNLATLEYPNTVWVSLELIGEIQAQCSVGERVVRQLEMFRPTFEALVSKGHTVSIKYQGDNVELTGFYTVAKETWVKEMQDSVEQWSKNDGWWIYDSD